MASLPTESRAVQTVDIHQVQQCWKRALSQSGIPEAAPAPLLKPDESVLVVNAGITPYKSTMLSGADLPPTATTQPCIRTHWKSGGLFLFSMLTAVGSRDRLDHGLALTRYFLNALPIDCDRYVCVVDERDYDVASCASALGDGMAVEYQSGSTDAYWTRWRFGHGERLVGRGLTIVARDREDCRYSLGNLIVVRHAVSNSDYFDIGFGLERIVSLFHGGDYWGGSIWKVPLERIATLGFDDAQARQVANRLVAVHRLIAEGAYPTAKGAGYLTRKLTRQAVDLVMDKVPADPQAAPPIERLLQASAILDAAAGLDAHEAVVDHVRDYLAGIEKAIGMVAKVSRRRGVDMADLDLSGTYGIPPWARCRILAPR